MATLLGEILTGDSNLPGELEGEISSEHHLSLASVSKRAWHVHLIHLLDRETSKIEPSPKLKSTLVLLYLNTNFFKNAPLDVYPKWILALNKVLARAQASLVSFSITYVILLLCLKNQATSEKAGEREKHNQEYARKYQEFRVILRLLEKKTH